MSESHDHELTAELQTLRETRVDAVAVRRVRDRLVHWAERESPRPRRERFGIRFAVGAVVLVAFVAIGAILFAMRRLSSHAELAVRSTEPPASSLSSVVADNASWRSAIGDSVESIILDDGTLRLHVKRKPGSRRVIVRVPDGEIDDLGTVFEVVVREGRTVAVRVDDGQVTLRLASMSPLTLEAGESWERAERAAPLRSSRVIDEHPRMKASQAATPPAPPLPPTRPVADEDAAYLAFIRAQRAGDTAAAKTNAASYLQSFPNGFRRDEVRRFIGE